MVKRDEIMRKILVIFGFTIVILFLCGCVDRSGYKECFDSYDNLILKDGWKISSHSSDFVCGMENCYFVAFQIHNFSDSGIEGETKYVYGFIYDSENDKLIYSPDGRTPVLPEEVLGYK